MLVNVGAERVDPGLSLDRLGARMGSGDRTTQRVGERLVNLAGQMVERALFVEPPHFDCPFDGRTIAADRESSIGLPRDGDHAAIDFGRIGRIDRKLGVAGGLALVERRIVEEWEAHGALDLQHLIADEKNRCGVGIDALDRAAAMRGRGGQKGKYLVLPVSCVVQAAAPTPVSVVRQSGFPAFPNLRYSYAY